MSDIGKWTTTEAVRAALGMTDNELVEDFMQDQNLDLQLDADLESWIPDLTTLEDSGKRVLRLYAMFFCAAICAEMWLAMPQRISDGKVDMRRFTDMDLKALADNMAARRDTYKAMIDPEADDLSPSNLMTHVAGATPAYDPVTNETT